MSVTELPYFLFAVDAAMAAVSWLILLCTYPDFRCWRQEDFRANHARYTGRVTWVVAPLILAQLAGHVWQVWQGAGHGPLWLVGAAWLVTFFWSVPLHRRLQALGQDEETIRRLVLSHLVRTLLWTALMIVQFRRAVG